VNLDDDFGRELARRIPRPGLNVIGYGFGGFANRRAGSVAGSALVTGPHGVRFMVTTPWGAARVSSPVLGRHNASNLLATLAVLLASGAKLGEAIGALGNLRPVPGRMQRVGGGAKPLVVVDYAHSPDALEHALRTLREVAAHGSRSTGRESRLTCVFGCGGERDRGKRPLMGRIATHVADRVIVTSDNPRGENPRRIIADVLGGARGGGGELAIIPDRRRAVRYAVTSAHRGDIVLLAGKGHEQWQLIAGVRHPYSDLAEARRALREAQ